jgi:hypothetical protein
MVRRTGDLCANRLPLLGSSFWVRVPVGSPVIGPCNLAGRAVADKHAGRGTSVVELSRQVRIVAF